MYEGMDWGTVLFLVVLAGWIIYTIGEDRGRDQALLEMERKNAKS